jgi:hypothetical protein
MARPAWRDAVDRANAEGRQPVVVITDRTTRVEWAEIASRFEQAGYVPVSIRLSADVSAEGPAPAALVAAGVREAAEAIRALSSRPAVVGHGLGGLVAQVLAAEALSAASVAICPAVGASATPPPHSPLLVIASEADPAHAAAAAGPDWEFLTLRPADDPPSGAPDSEMSDAALSFLQRFV